MHRSHRAACFRGSTCPPRRGKLRLDHYSLRAGQAYVDWIKRSIRRLGKRRPRETGAVEVAQRGGQIVPLPSAVRPAGRIPALRSR